MCPLLLIDALVLWQCLRPIKGTAAETIFTKALASNETAIIRRSDLDHQNGKTFESKLEALVRASRGTAPTPCRFSTYSVHIQSPSGKSAQIWEHEFHEFAKSILPGVTNSPATQFLDIDWHQGTETGVIVFKRDHVTAVEVVKRISNITLTVSSWKTNLLNIETPPQGGKVTGAKATVRGANEFTVALSTKLKGIVRYQYTDGHWVVVGGASPTNVFSPGYIK
jgi:hypothetical protein